MGDAAGAWDDRAAATALRAGDAAAWRGLYARHFDRLAGYVRWRCGGLADLADDVLQDAWLTAVRRIGSFDPDRGAFLDWLCGIASNAARNAVRARQRAARRVGPLADADPPAAAPDRAAADKAERVAAALAALPARYEAALRAKYLDRMSVAEIAAARGESEKAVESLLTRARQAFREAYETHD